jgi:hypothetical protein
MTDASEAGRALARRRWGDRRVRGLIDELVRRISEVDEPEAARLRAVLDESRERRGVSAP